jgi:hypothetical protein
MATIENINIDLGRDDESSFQQAHPNLNEVCSVNIQAANDWVVTGKYRNNILCGIEIKRNSCTPIGK